MEKSGNQRDVVISVVMLWIPDVLIAVAAMKLTDDEWSTFWWVWIAIQALYLLNWAKKTLWDMLVWRLWARRRTSAAALNVLRSCRFPKPQVGEYDVNDFFSRVMADDEQPIAVRLRAAEWRAAVHAGMSEGFRSAAQLGSAWRDALVAFAKA